jgi:hypothetical protein
MGYFAGNNRISTDPFSGSIPITADQYSTALDAITVGKRVSIDGGFKILGVSLPGVDDPGPPTVDDVAAERDRRLATGFSYDFKDSRGVVQIGTTDKDMIGWDEVTKLAQAYINTSQPAQPIEIETNSGAVSVTALEWQSVLIAAGAFRQPIWQASFVLQAMDPIPADYADNEHWPA